MPFQGWGKEEILFKFLKFQGVHLFTSMGSPGGSVGKESACNVGDLGLIPRLERSPGEGNGNPLQYSCLENLIDRGAGLKSMGSQRVRHD